MNSTQKPAVSKSVMAAAIINWLSKLGLLGFALSLYNGKSDVPIENAFVFGFIFLLLISLGVESLLRLYATKRAADLISIHIAGAFSAIAVGLALLLLERILNATNYRIGLPQVFVIAFAWTYLSCFAYLSRKFFRR